MNLRVYVASWFENRPKIREIHSWMFAKGIDRTARWVEVPDGVPNMKTPEASRAACVTNDYDVERAHVLLVIAEPGRGGEMFAEARFALTLGIPILWCGRLILSAYRPGVHRCEDGLDEAKAILEHEAMLLERSVSAGTFKVAAGEHPDIFVRHDIWFRLANLEHDLAEAMR